jgi:hypothetical protein
MLWNLGAAVPASASAVVQHSATQERLLQGHCCCTTRYRKESMRLSSDNAASWLEDWQIQGECARSVVEASGDSCATVAGIRGSKRVWPAVVDMLYVIRRSKQTTQLGKGGLRAL